MFDNDDVSWSMDADGHAIATLEIPSNVLPVLTIDTDSVLSIEHWIEAELDGMISYYHYITGRWVTGTDLEPVFDSKLRVQRLAEAAVQVLSEALEDEGIASIGDVLDIHVPQFYNFETDSFTANWTVNMSRLRRWASSRNFNYRKYGLDHFSSRSGFHSFVPNWLDNPDKQEALEIWLMLHGYLSEVLDWDEFRDAMGEFETDILDETVSFELDEYAVMTRLVTELWDVIGGERCDADDFVWAHRDEIMGTIDDMMDSTDLAEYHEWIKQRLDELVTAHNVKHGVPASAH